MSAEDASDVVGTSYHDLERESESNAHASARERAIGYFTSRGFHVYPKGVGIDGVLTFADLIAVRGDRTIFVEVLSDSGLCEETLARKAQLQNYAELCFVFFYGNKVSDDPGLMLIKRSVERWADVLYCRIHGWSGNFIQDDSRMSVAFDTTRDIGIVARGEIKIARRKVEVAVSFVTHLYENPMNTTISNIVGARSYRYEKIWLSVFRDIAKNTGHNIRYRLRFEENVTIRTMRRQSGLQMYDATGKISMRLRSENREPDAKENPNWDCHPQSRDIPVEYAYGVFVLERTGSEGINHIVRAFRQQGINLQLNAELKANAFKVLEKQVQA